MRKFCVGTLVMTLAGCATTQPGQVSSHDAAVMQDCTRFEAAVRAHGDVFNPVKMQKRAIDECGQGRLGACVAAPFAMPYTIFLGVFTAPLLIPMFMSLPNVQRVECPQESTATSAEVPEQGPASPGERP